MKTIEVTEEMYQKLIDISKELNSQNNRGTATPYFYQVQVEDMIFGIDEQYSVDGYVWIDKKNGGDTTDSDRNSMMDTLENNEIEFDKDKISDKGLEDLMEENGYEKGFYRIENRYSNCFLTEKSCKRHIQAKKHHYNNPIDYLMYADSNPELETIITFLKQLTKINIKKSQNNKETAEKFWSEYSKNTVKSTIYDILVAYANFVNNK